MIGFQKVVLCLCQKIQLVFIKIRNNWPGKSRGGGNNFVEQVLFSFDRVPV